MSQQSTVEPNVPVVPDEEPNPMVIRAAVAAACAERPWLESGCAHQRAKRLAAFLRAISKPAADLADELAACNADVQDLAKAVALSAELAGGLEYMLAVFAEPFTVQVERGMRVSVDMEGGERRIGHVLAHDQQSATVSFENGEPLTVGLDRIAALVEARE